jgi:hypothetical protein
MPFMAASSSTVPAFVSPSAVFKLMRASVIAVSMDPIAVACASRIAVNCLSRAAIVSSRSRAALFKLLIMASRFLTFSSSPETIVASAPSSASCLILSMASAWVLFSCFKRVSRTVSFGARISAGAREARLSASVDNCWLADMRGISRLPRSVVMASSDRSR